MQKFWENLPLPNAILFAEKPPEINEYNPRYNQRSPAQ